MKFWGINATPQERMVPTWSCAADTASNELLIDFDAIERVMIKPALVAALMRGDTTGAWSKPAISAKTCSTD